MKYIKILLCLLLLTTACQKTPKFTFMVGGSANALLYWERVTKEFETKKGIKIELIRLPADTEQRRQRIVIPLQAKASDPDVFLMDVIWVGMIAGARWLEPLNHYINRDNFDINKFFKRVIEDVDTFKHKIIALPVYVDGGLLYYRKDLLTKYGYHEPPSTWETLVNMAKQIQKKERIQNKAFWGFVWQGAMYEGLICTFLEFCASGNGGISFDPLGKIKVNTMENQKALKFMVKLIHQEGISPPNTFTELKEEEVRLIFQQGNALFERNWPYAWKLHQEDPFLKGKVGITQLPHFEGGKTASTLGGWHIGISKFSDVKEMAWEFVKFVTSFEQQKRFVLKLSWNPGRLDVYQDSEIREKMSHLIILKNVFENAVARPLSPYYSQISQILQRHINAALALKEIPDEALKKAQAEIDQLFAYYGD
ncbi:MAG: putative ABC transporter-binding protein [Candidatus Methanoperedenaceae archaeon GB50]|nr:putative ABC transporter-binding protein [Candidatus Methanoperedenaceae archaeon GB50]CAD7772312.1 putative ABC transporter-binding protein [Candidatus Methanoperedenaceae archaeon GB37]CAD7773896.1 MAG: putative ABC transporter-binding protein [Candidatus Methanoperedenaceae archaeon GB50]